jgi:hypothetical protein
MNINIPLLNTAVATTTGVAVASEESENAPDLNTAFA